MIRISTRGSHAWRAMLDPAPHPGGRHGSRRDIAARQEFSADDVAQP